MTTQECRLVVIGAGAAGAAHAAAASECGARIVGVVDIDEKRAAAIAVSHGARIAPTIADLDLSCGIAVICVPNALHGRVAIECLNRGLDILVEKPFDTCLERVCMVNALAIHHKLVCGAVAQHRYSTAATYLRKIVKEQVLGTLRSASVLVSRARLPGFLEGWRGDPNLAGGGVLATIGFHYLDLLVDLLDGHEDLVIVNSLADSAPIDSRFFGEFAIKDIPCKISCGWGNVVSRPDYLYVEGSDGSAHLEGGELRLVACGRVVERIDAEDKSALRSKVWSDFLESTIRRSKPKVTVNEILPTMQVIDALYRSCQTGL